MVMEHNLERLYRLIVFIVKKIVGIKFTAIFTYDPENKVYALKSYSRQGH